MTTSNPKSPAVKRLMREALELSQPTVMYFAQPLEDNLFEWHFTIRGPDGSDFAGGIYHGRINLPSEYPMKPPNITLLTPNGRFEQYRQICLSISGYHPETWLPSWSIRTALLAIIGFMPTTGAGAIGSMDLPPEQRRKMAKSSEHYVCDVCGPTKNLVLPLTSPSTSITEEAKELAAKCSISDPAKDNNAPEVKSIPVATPEASTSSAQAQPWTPVTCGLSGLNTFSGLPQPSYWLCYPVYGNPAPNNNAAVVPTSSNLTTADGGPLGFEEWLKKIRECEPASTSSDQPSSSTIDIKIDLSLKESASKVTSIEEDAPKTYSPDVTSMSAVSEAMLITKELENRIPSSIHESQKPAPSTTNTKQANSHPTAPVESDKNPELPTINASSTAASKVTTATSVSINSTETIAAAEVRQRPGAQRPLARSSREAAERILKEAAAKHRQRLQVVTGQTASVPFESNIPVSETSAVLVSNRHRQNQQRTVRMAQLAALGLSLLLLTLICRRLVLMVF